jgi:hypothetical protein
LRQRSCGKSKHSKDGGINEREPRHLLITNMEDSNLARVPLPSGFAM